MLFDSWSSDWWDVEIFFDKCMNFLNDIEGAALLFDLCSIYFLNLDSSDVGNSSEINEQLLKDSIFISICI